MCLLSNKLLNWTFSSFAICVCLCEKHHWKVFLKVRFIQFPELNAKGAPTASFSQWQPSSFSLHAWRHGCCLFQPGKIIWTYYFCFAALLCVIFVYNLTTLPILMSFSVCDTVVSEISNFVVNRRITWDSGGEMNFESREVSFLPGSALTSYVSLPGQLIALGFRFFI